MRRAINAATKEAQQQIIQELPDRFTLRKQRVPQGIRYAGIKNKTSEAAVFTLDWFMKEQEDGGTRKAKEGPLFVPTDSIRRGGSFQGLPMKRAPTLLKLAAKPQPKRRKIKKDGSYPYRKPTPFHVKPGGKLKPGIWIREQSGPRDAENPGIKLLYKQEQSVQIKPRWKGGETFTTVVEERFPTLFFQHLDNAIVTSKKNIERNQTVHLIAEHAPSVTGGGLGFLDTLRNNRP